MILLGILGWFASRKNLCYGVCDGPGFIIKLFIKETKTMNVNEAYEEMFLSTDLETLARKIINLESRVEELENEVLVLHGVAGKFLSEIRSLN